MESFTIDQYKQANCPLASGRLQPFSIEAFKTDLRKADGKYCDKCINNTNHNCLAYMILISNKPFSTVQPIFTENIRAEAARLGLSISEVRRRRSGK